jgi:hypothetical protein
MKKFVYVPAFNPEYFKQGHPYQLVHRDHPTEACVAILKPITANHLEFIFINSNGMVQSFHLNIEDTNVVTVSRLVADPEDEEGVEIPTEAKPEHQPQPQTQTQYWDQPQQIPMNPTETASMSDQQITPGTFVEDRQTRERFAIWSVDTDKVYLRSLDHEDNVTIKIAPNDLMRDFIRVGIMSLSVDQWNRFEAYTDNRSRSEPQQSQPVIQQTSPPMNQQCKFKVGDVIAPLNVIGPATTYRIQEMIVNPMTHNVDYAIIRRTDNSGDDIRVERKTLETQYKIVDLNTDDGYGVSPLRPIRFA